MKKSENNLFNYIVLIAILLISLTITICDSIIDSFNLWTHPILNFLFFIFSLTGIFIFIKAILIKKPIAFFLASILLGLSSLYLLLQYLFVWLSILIVVTFCGVIALLSLAICGNNTENIALNKNPEYKDYKTRMAEKNKELDNQVKEKVEIKSFKD